MNLALLAVAGVMLNIKRYAAALLADVLHQFTFKNNSPLDEKTKTPLSLFGGVTVSGGKVVSPPGPGQRYHFNGVGFFGAGDFTYEVMFKLLGNIVGEGALLPCHWHNGGMTSIDNRFIVIVLPTGALQVVFSRSGTALDYVVNTSGPNLIKQNIDYHIVIERYNGTIKVFVDGTAILSWGQASPFWWNSSGNYLTNNFNGTGYAASAWWNLRLSKRAMYKHTVTPPSPFPEIP